LLSDIPDWYGFLFDKKPPILGKDIDIETLHDNNYDLVILLDVNSNSQLPRLDDFLTKTDAPILILDHHITNDGLGTVEIIDTSASATGLIVLDLFGVAGWPLSESIARSLFVAVATDTGWFQFSNTDARTYTACAQLTLAGANPTQLHHDLYYNFSIPRFNLMLKMLNSLELHFDNRYADQQITLNDFAQTGATHKDTENLIGQCQKIGSVQAAALFIELPDGKIRCSLRGSGTVDVRIIAQKFDGGGHKMASGTYLPAPIQNAKQLIKQEIEKQLP
jgi:phosphoesterase RecJ-like protein